MDAPTSPLSSLPPSIPSSPSQDPESDASESDIAAERPSRKHSKSRKRRKDNKLDKVLAHLRSIAWTVGDFLEELESRKEIVPYKEDRSYKIAYHSFTQYAYKDLPQRCSITDTLGKHPDPSFKEWAFNVVGEELRTELNSLVKHEAFGSWELSALQKSQDLTFTGVPEVIVERAPSWLKLIDTACSVKRSRKSQSQEFARELVLPISMICKVMHPRGSDKMGSTLGIYLYHAGTRRRAIDTLAGLGVCSSYKSTLRRIEQMAEATAEEVRLLGRNAMSVPTYDNFEWQEGRRGERLGDQRPGLRSITTALVVEDRLKLTNLLSSNMWQPEKHPLMAEDIAIALSTDMGDIKIKMRLHHMEAAIKSIIADEATIANIQWVSEAPILGRLSPIKTRYHPLRPIMKNESFTADNIQIMEDILYKQFNLSREDEAFQGGFRMFAGDLKTWERMRAVKTLRGETAACRVDSFQWLIPTIGLWHLEYNMASLLHRAHWGEPRHADQSHLQFVADRWNRTQAVDGKKYEAVVELLMHSYYSRIVAALLSFIKTELMLNIVRVEDLVAWLTDQSKTSMAAALKAVALRLEPEDPVDVTDDVYHNHELFCSHVESFMTLRYAIKHADIGILRFALRDTTMLFLSREARSPKYSRALLYTLHLVDSPAADKRLQDYVLANSLVNLQGKEDTNFELDRLLELHNGKLKKFQKERTNFATDRRDEVLQRWALIGPMLDRLQDSIERPFGEHYAGEHAPKKADEDIFSMAVLLSTSSLKEPRLNQFSRSLAPELLRLGCDRLGEAVYDYTEQYDFGIHHDISLVSSFDEKVSELEVPDAPLINCDPLRDDELPRSQLDLEDL